MAAAGNANRSMREGTMQHCFRHRFHPKTKEREHVWIPASKNFSIEKDCRIISKEAFEQYLENTIMKPLEEQNKNGGKKISRIKINLGDIE
jgi:hypothetical protein